MMVAMHLILYFTSLLALSTSPIFAKYSQIPIESLGFYRLALSAVLLLLFLSFRKNFEIKKLFQLKLEPSTYWLTAAAFSFFLHLFCYFYAAHHTSIANTTIVYASNPLFSSLLSALLFKEKLTWRFFISYFLAFIGLSFLFQKNSIIEITTFKDFLFLEFKLAEFAALLSAIFFAFYINFSKKARGYFNNETYAFIKYTIAAILFLIWGLGQNNIIWPIPSTGLVGILGQVLLPTFLGHFLFSYLLKFMNIQLMTCGKLIEPLLSSLIAFFIFNEVLRPNTWFAFLLMSCALLVLFSNILYKHFVKKEC